MQYATGAVYEGWYSDGLRYGHGVMTDENGGFVYDGEWMLGHMTGRGKMRTTHGLHGPAKYDGTFVDGRLHGHGRVEFAAGTEGVAVVYEGEWRGGKRHGRGTCRRHQRDVYEGEWRADLRHGYGVLLTPDDRIIYAGTWNDGAMASWNLLAARRFVGWAMVHIVYPACGAAMAACALALLAAVLLAAPST
jgi:hypothetical protein